MNKHLVFTIFLVFLFALNSKAQNNIAWNDTSYFIPYDDDFNLISSASKGHKENAINLLNRGANINSVTIDGISALMYASDNGDLDMVKFLMENKANPNLKPFNGVTALIGAVVQNHFEVAEYLASHGANVDAQDENGVTALHNAAAYNDYDFVDMLIFYRANIDLPDNEGNTPLITASFNNCIETVDLLLQKGADIDNKDNKGFTALMVAVDKGNSDIVDLLLANGADVNKENMGGMSPLGFAVNTENYKLSERLISEGADINHKINNSRNILELAKASKDEEIIELLESEGAKSNRLPYFNRISLGWGLNFNFDDFMTGFDVGLEDIKYNMGIEGGFYFRPAAIRIIEQESNNTFYQYWERRYYFYLGLDKKFQLINFNEYLSSGPVLGIKEIYTFGGYRGSNSNPESRFITAPKIGWYISNNVFTTSLSYEYINFDIPEMKSGRINLSFLFNFSLTKKSMQTKQIEWLTL
jgi:ankyrin repeat protein